MLGYWEHLGLAQSIMLIGKEAISRTWVSTLLVGCRVLFLPDHIPYVGITRWTQMLGTFMET